MGPHTGSIYFFEKLCEMHNVVLLTYENESLDLYSNQVIDKCKVNKLPYKQQSDIFNSFFKRLTSSQLPGFSSHDKDSISQKIDEIDLKYGKFDIYYFATQLMGQIILSKKFSGKKILDLYDIYYEHRKGKLSDVPFWKPHHWLFRLEAIRVKRYEKKY